METTGLTENLIQQYRRDGYLVVQNFFGTKVIDKMDRRIRQITEDALASNDYSSILEVEPEMSDGQIVPRRIFNPYDLHDDFKSLANDPKLLDCIEGLIGPNINLQHSKLNMKPPNVGSVVEWHQDLAYFLHTNDDLITCLIYLDDATTDNGCLRVLPRHHTHFFDHTTPDGQFAGMITEDIESGQFGRPVPLEAPADSVIFMHCITPHHSHSNLSKKSRRTLIFEYCAADAYPIFCGDLTQITNVIDRPIRGKSGPYARCGGPAPYVSKRSKYTSLFQLQKDAKAAMTNQTT